MTDSLFITRVINACVLLEIGEDVVLTDPYFRNPGYHGIEEPIGVPAEDLPKLSAIIGCLSIFDHWQIRSLDAYSYKQETPVYCATRLMARRAKAAGFTQIEVVRWNETRQISERLSLEVLPAQYTAGMRVNNYVLSTPNLRIFFGSEVGALKPLREYRERTSRPIDVVFAPVNGLRLLGFLKLVLSGEEAVEATRILGAKTLVPIHDAHRRNLLFMMFPSSSAASAQAAAEAMGDELNVIRLATGERWEYCLPSAAFGHSGGSKPRNTL